MTKFNPERKFTLEQQIRGWDNAYDSVLHMVEEIGDGDGSFYERYHSFKDFIRGSPLPITQDMSFEEAAAAVNSYNFVWDAEQPAPAQEPEEDDDETPEPGASTCKGEDISHMSAMGFMISNDPMLSAFLAGGHKYAVNLTARELAKKLGDWLRAVKKLPDDAILGAFKRITEEEFHAWEYANAAEFTLVGPYLALKYLLQNGALFEFFEDEVAPSLRVARNGVKVYATNRYDMDLEEGGHDHEGKRREMDTLLRGIKVGSKQVRVVSVTEDTYDVVNMIMFRYDVKCEKNVLNITLRQNPQTYGGPANATIGALVASLLSEPTKPGTDADEIIDWMARCLHARHSSKVTDAVKAYNKAEEKARDRVADFAERCAEKKGELHPAKLAFLSKIAISPDVGAAMTTLKAAREKRNRQGAKQTSQYLQKNVASVYAPRCMPMFDTHCKLRNVIAELAKLVPTDWDSYPVQVYGVAYNHMGNAIEQLTKGKPKYYDVNIPTNANTPVEKADIFDVAVGPRTVLIDDTYVETITKERKEQNPNIHSGSLLKLRNIILASPDIVATKLSLSIFTEDVIAMIINAGYKHNVVAKFGKLHNAEVFLIMSKYAPRMRNSAGVLKGDVQSCATAVQVANHVIMIADAQGVTLDMTPPIWRQIMSVLPVKWPWYLEPITKEKMCTGGEGGSGSVIDSAIDVVYEDPDAVVEDAPAPPTYVPPTALAYDVSGCTGLRCLTTFLERVSHLLTDKVAYKFEGRSLLKYQAPDAEPPEMVVGKVSVYAPSKLTNKTLIHLKGLPASDDIMRAAVADTVLSQNQATAAKVPKWKTVKT